MGHERAHAEFAGQDDGLPVMAFSGLDLREMPIRGNLTQEAQGICLVTLLLVRTGERSRLYIARALLQEAHLVILDESFAALDPETLHRCLHRVLKRADTLLVIAHP